MKRMSENFLGRSTEYEIQTRIPRIFLKLDHFYVETIKYVDVGTKYVKEFL